MEALAAAVEGRARYLGFVFCSVSRHRIDATAAASLIARVPSSMASVGLFVDPSDDEIAHVLKSASLSMIQLHGSETPERVSSVKTMTGLPVIKALGISALQNVAAARLYEPVADFLLLDAKPPPGGNSGGNGVVFDWGLLKNASFSKPWLLAGGLNARNIEAAVAATRARILDVSSGVEDDSGKKSPDKIREFLDRAHALETCY
jgi:phosphoribosylanthranilate isomerase